MTLSLKIVAVAAIFLAEAIHIRRVECPQGNLERPMAI